MFEEDWEREIRFMEDAPRRLKELQEIQRRTEIMRQREKEMERIARISETNPHGLLPTGYNSPEEKARDNQIVWGSAVIYLGIPAIAMFAVYIMNP